MATIAAAIRELEAERNRAQAELGRLEKAISVLRKLDSADFGGAAVRRGPRPGRRRKLSAAARKRISMAQKARWAKVKKEES